MEVIAKTKNRKTVVMKIKDGFYHILFIRLIDKSEDWSGYIDSPSKQVKRSRNGMARILWTRIQLHGDSINSLWWAKAKIDTLQVKEVDG